MLIQDELAMESFTGVRRMDHHFLSPLQDEQSAVSMLKKHQILEQAVEDYAETVHQLSKTSRTLVADNHPERYKMLFLIVS